MKTVYVVQQVGFDNRIIAIYDSLEKATERAEKSTTHIVLNEYEVKEMVVE